MNVTVLYPASNGSNVRRSKFGCLLLSTNVMFTSRRKSRVRGQGGRAACSGPVSGMGTVQHGHRPATVIYPQRASAVAACRSSEVVGVAAQIPSPIMPTHRAKRSQLSAVFTGTNRAPLIGSTINPRFTAPDRRPVDDLTGASRPGGAGGDKDSHAKIRRTMLCRTDTWKMWIGYPTNERHNYVERRNRHQYVVSLVRG